MKQAHLEQIFGAVRHLLTLGAGYMAGKGWIGDDEVTTGVGAMMTLIALGWSWWEKRA